MLNERQSLVTQVCTMFGSEALEMTFRLAISQIFCIKRKQKVKMGREQCKNRHVPHLHSDGRKQSVKRNLSEFQNERQRTPNNPLN